jgi:DNA (cytosine-5)-methyltransferase 1
MKPRLLDLHCGEGGAGVGYARAGFEVVGVDKEPKTRYPFEFHQADSLEYLAEHWREFDVIHVSPVCKGYSPLAALYPDKEYPDEIATFRKALRATGKPYVIENVSTAPLENYVMLCGSMFGLKVYRHRLFECNPPIMFSPMSCNHWGKASGNKSMKAEKRVTPNLDDFEILTVTGHDFILESARVAMGTPWMSQSGISQAVPPAYTEYIGNQLMNVLQATS